MLIFTQLWKIFSLWNFKNSRLGFSLSGSLIIRFSYGLNKSSNPSAFDSSGENIILKFSSIPNNPLSKALSCNAFKHSPFLGFKRLSLSSLQGLIWLATNNSGCFNPVIQHWLLYAAKTLERKKPWLTRTDILANLSLPFGISGDSISILLFASFDWYWEMTPSNSLLSCSQCP